MFEWLFKYSREDYARGELVFTGAWTAGFVIALAVFASVIIALLLLRQRKQLTPYQLITLGLLQIMVVFTVLTMVRQPALRTDTLASGENTLALVLDTSGSMQYGVAASRLEIAREALTRIEVSAAADGLMLQRFELAGSAQSVAGFGESQPAGQETSIAASLLTVLQEARSSSLAAVVLASDGIDTAGGISAEELAAIAAFGIPIHTVAIGRATMPEDIELAQVTLPKRALPGSMLSARVSIRHDGAGSTRIKVYDDDELLLSNPVQLQADATTTSIRIDLQPRSEGHRQLRFSLDSLADEQELRNNNRAMLVNIEGQTHRVLYVEGEPRWEYKFLRRAVADDAEIRLVSLLSVSPNKYYRQGLESPEQLADGFPVSRAELFAYDALIIGSVEAAAFTSEQLAAIRDFVSARGGSLLLLAGPNGLGNGGWGQSDIADLLPVRLPPSSMNSFVRKQARPLLTPQGAHSEILKLAASADNNRRSWAELPAIADYQQTGEPKPAATVLLTVATESGTMPLLATQPFGRGNAYVLATGGTWRWQMSLPSEDQRHETFWRQLLRALVANVPAMVAVTAESQGSTLKLHAEFRDASFETLSDLDVTAALAHEEGASSLIEMQLSPTEPGVYLAEIEHVAAGSWYVEAVAERDGESFGIARAATYADTAEAEFFNIRTNAGLLRRLSAATAGKQLGPDDTDALTDLLRYSGAGITEAVYRPFWDAPAVLLLLLLAKIAEWLLRRRWRSI